MKRQLFMLFFAMIALPLFAQDIAKTPIKGFWGLSFEDSRTVAMDLLERKNDRVMTFREYKSDGIFLENLTFGGERFDTGLLVFKNDKLCSGFFLKQVPDKSTTFTIFHNIITPLKAKYGEPKISAESSVSYVWTDEFDSKISANFKPTEDNQYEISLLYVENNIGNEKEITNPSDDF